MQQSTIEITTPDGSADAYLARPDGDGDHPALLMFMDAFGLRPRLYEMADRIAARGYVVLVPNLFYRAGTSPLFDLSGLDDAKQREAVFGKIMPLMAALTPEVIARDSGAYLDFLAEQDGVQAGPVALTGYCMGGMDAVRVAQAHPDRIALVAGFHAGRLVTDAPDSPHLGVAAITAEVYLAHADQDHSMTADQIKVLEAALDEAGVTYGSEIYSGAPHGFTMSDSAAYHEEGERRHWTKLFELLDRTF